METKPYPKLSILDSGCIAVGRDKKVEFED